MIVISLGTVILFLCYGMGGNFAGLWSKSSAGERLVYGTGIGMGILAYLILALGVCGQLNPAGLAGILIFSAMLTFWRFRENTSAFLKVLSGFSFNRNLVSAGFFILTSLLLVSVVSGVLSPETAGDSLCYHLHIPKIYLLEHRIPWRLPYEINAYFPFLMEMLYTLGIAVGGSPLAKFFHLSSGLLASGAIFLILRRSAQTRTALLGSLLFLTTPAIVNHLAKTYVDIALAAYAILALAAYFGWAETREEKYLILSGSFSGLMMSVKYLALAAIFPIVILIIARSIILKQPRMILPRITKFAWPALLFSFVWYLHSYLVKGNPVYPYFPAIFGKGISQYSYHEFGVQIHAVKDFFSLIWHSTMSPKEPSPANPIGFSGLGEMLGPAYLCFLPFIFFARKRKYFWDWIFYSAVFFVFWAFLGQVIRFIFPLLPALSVLIAWGIEDVSDSKVIKRTLLLLAFLILALHAFLGVFYFRRTFKVALGMQSEHDYLLKNERSYQIADYINRELPPHAVILNFDEIRMFYIRRPIVREDVYYFETRYADRFKVPEEVISFIRSAGFTHILFTDSPEDPTPRLPASLRIPSLLEHAEKRLADRLELVYTATFVPPKAGEIRYRLYKIL